MLLAMIVVIVLIILWYLNRKITNIYVIGNYYVLEKDIVTINNLYYYPKVKDFNKEDFMKKIRDNPLINDIDVKVTLFGKVIINIKENNPICRYQDKIILSDGNMEKFDIYLKLPLLINDIDSEVYDNFIKKMLLIDKSILSKISEIEYIPSSIDHEKFYFLMNDGNGVYITLSKITSINSYNEIYSTLEGKKGILHLDSGNHFEIKESS